ncbi:TIGR01212 family radical SAM protein [Trichlorobacter sp.]|jgi:radical SAM protein (TIGR01212 family)|uniref:TIGR01212 family radical SAM protein n=1 Tax=Trichlorobacter sp. TaxID=2911007 RepID=UPI002A36B5F2|nr:TIGR01212 family radical SAM protein [Trichlorobacter sp.]MDY0383273.1 TIGR01212 family radical SAM protein [Trichlorobacter sp.]
MTTKRYTTFTAELRQRFGCRVQRISLDAGLTCPNRDGSLGIGGCSFCGDRGAAAVGVQTELPLAEQLQRSKEYLRRKFKADQFIGYFQAYSNTYASVGALRNLYQTALADPELVGMIIGTRPDCLPEPVLDLLTELHAKTYLWLELGMQTMHDGTLAAINRGHDHACLVEAVQRCQARGLRVCVHLILGLPGETREQMLASVRELNRLGVDGVKLHHLHVLKGSRLVDDYQRGALRLLEREEYVQLVCDALELLDPRIVIHRLMGDGRSELLAPDWSRRKLEVLNLIDAELKKRDSRQGCRLSE